MSTDIHAEENVEVAGLVVNASVAFRNHKGVHKKGLEKRQRKLLDALGPHLQPFMQEGEQVQLITTACSPMGFLEQWTTGWMIYYIKRAILVFTDRRMFHIPTKHNFAYRHSIAQVTYGDVARFQGGSKLQIIYKSGKPETFLMVHGKERARLKKLLPTLATSHPGPGQGRVHLCPRCTTPLTPGHYRCQSCQLEFKNKKDAALISWLVPGGGYFYVGRHLLGLGDALTEVLLIVAMVASIVDLYGGEEGATAGLLIFGPALLLEKIVTVFHSNHFVKEFIPKEKRLTQMSTA